MKRRQFLQSALMSASAGSMAFVGLPALAAAAVLIVRKKHTDD